jgi:hypothetical protein
MGILGCLQTEKAPPDIFAREDPFLQTQVKLPPLSIAEKDLPPPGKCRIWYRDEPPAKQPAPGNCKTLFREVPEGVWLLSRTYDNPERIRVMIREPSGVIIYRWYVSKSGRFLMEERL